MCFKELACLNLRTFAAALSSQARHLENGAISRQHYAYAGCETVLFSGASILNGGFARSCRFILRTAHQVSHALRGVHAFSVRCWR